MKTRWEQLSVYDNSRKFITKSNFLKKKNSCFFIKQKNQPRLIISHVNLLVFSSFLLFPKEEWKNVKTWINYYQRSTVVKHDRLWKEKNMLPVW